MFTKMKVKAQGPLVFGIRFDNIVTCGRNILNSEQNAKCQCPIANRNCVNCKAAFTRMMSRLWRQNYRLYRIAANLISD